MLYSTIYYHQKIRSAECGIKGIFEIIKANKNKANYQILGRKMDRAIDYLYATEEDILSLNNKPVELSTYIGQFLSRKLFKRALVISTDTVENPSISPGYQKFKSLAENPIDLIDLRNELTNALNGTYPPYQIWIDLPQTLTFTDALFVRIQDEGQKLKYLPETFRVAEWLTAYASNKWKAYVFCPYASNKDRENVGRKAAELISSKYEFSMKVDDAISQSKIR